MQNKLTIIAEAASCGDGQLHKMNALAITASNVGADAVKFQWTSSATKMARRRHASKTPYLSHYRKYLQWSKDWHEQLRTISTQHNIRYLCSVYLPEDVEVIAPHVDAFKISSFECGDIELLDAMLSHKKPVYLSTGITEEKDLEFLLRYSADDVKLLHCVSAYPTPLADCNLSVLRTRISPTVHTQLDANKTDGISLADSKRKSISFDGFSDHTNPNYVSSGALAVMAGATILEAHLRLRTTDVDNPDYPHAMTSDQFQSYVLNAKEAISMLGSGKKAVTQSEQSLSGFRVVQTK